MKVLISKGITSAPRHIDMPIDGVFKNGAGYAREEKVWSGGLELVGRRQKAC